MVRARACVCVGGDKPKDGCIMQEAGMSKIATVKDDGATKVNCCTISITFGKESEVVELQEFFCCGVIIIVIDRLVVYLIGCVIMNW